MWGKKWGAQTYHCPPSKKVGGGAHAPLAPPPPPLPTPVIYKHNIDCYTILITRFRVSALTLLNEKDRYPNTESIFQMCDMNDVEDEYHFILKSRFYTNLRLLYIKKYYCFKPTVFNLMQLFSVLNRKELCNIGKSKYL